MTGLKKIPLFWVLYAAITAFFLILLIVGLILLNGYLTAYEAAQPIHGAEEVFEQYFVGERFVEALELAGFETGEFETREAAAAALAKKKEGKEFAFYSVPTGEGEAKYNIVLVDPADQAKGEENTTGELSVQGIPSTKVATVTLKQSETEGDWGFFGYEFSSLEMFLKGEFSVSVSVPSTSRLTLNGKEIPKEYLTGSADHKFNAFLRDGVTGITMDSYRVDGLFLEPTLACTDKNGLEQTLSADENGVLVASLNYDEALREQHSARMLEGMKEYAKYIQDDGSLGRVAPYFDTSSLFYRHIRENTSWFVWDHNGYSFRNESASEFYAFDENTFCCRISFEQVLHHWGKEDYVDPLDMIIFVRKIGNTYRIYDRFNLE